MRLNLHHIWQKLKPRSWKHWLFWVELIPAFFILLIGGLLGFFGYQAHSDRYPDLAVRNVPNFQEISLPFAHKYDSGSNFAFLGSAIIDVDNDGVEELFLGGGKNQADALMKFENNKFVNVAKNHGLENPNSAKTFGVAVIDVDENGWDDMFIAREDGVYLDENFDGKFREKKLDMKFNKQSTPFSIALGDINKDGFVDLFVSAYISEEFVTGLTVFNDKNYGATSLLFLNNGDNTWTDITKFAGIEFVHNTFQAVFVDLDLDQDQDLVVAHDTGMVKTYRNNGDNTFTDMPNPTSNYFSYPMGIAVGDYDNDGLSDLAFSNIGNMGPMNGMVRGDLRKDQPLHRDIIVFHNDGNFQFTDTAKELNLAKYEFSWGLIFEDFNANGLQDLVISENFIQMPSHQIFPLPGRFLLQTDNGKFTAKEKEAGVVNRKYATSPLSADFNNDGAIDLIYANVGDNSLVFLNSPVKNNYLRVKLPNTANSLGATVEVHLDYGQVLTRQFITSEGLLSDSSHILYFGLGNSAKLSKIVVKWIDGSEKVIENVKINTLLKITKNEK